MSLHLRGHKYGATATVMDGVRFASMKEARRYQELRLLEKAGEISGLELQPRFAVLIENARYPERGGRLVHVCTYVADFRYRERGETVVEDVKGMKTRVYRLKKKLVEAQYGIEIREL